MCAPTHTSTTCSFSAEMFGGRHIFVCAKLRLCVKTKIHLYMHLNDVSFAVFRMFNTEFIRNKIRNKNKNTNKRNANTFLRGNRPANSAKCAFNRAKIVRMCFFFELSIPGGMPDRDCVIFASNLSFALHPSEIHSIEGTPNGCVRKCCVSLFASISSQSRPI